MFDILIEFHSRVYNRMHVMPRLTLHSWWTHCILVKLLPVCVQYGVCMCIREVMVTYCIMCHMKLSYTCAWSCWNPMIIYILIMVESLCIDPMVFFFFLFQFQETLGEVELMNPRGWFWTLVSISPVKSCVIERLARFILPLQSLGNNLHPGLPSEMYSVDRFAYIGVYCTA